MAGTYKQTYVRLSQELFQYWGYTGPMLMFLAGYKIFDEISESHLSID